MLLTQVRKQQLELDMEQQTGSKLGKEYVRAVYCHPAYLTYMQSWTQLSNFTFTFHFHTLEKEMATYSSVLAWRISGMGEPRGLPSMGSHRVGHD